MGALQATHDLLVVYLILRSNVGSQPVRLEAEIDELAGRIESCRKFILAGRRRGFLRPGESNP